MLMALWALRTQHETHLKIIKTQKNNTKQKLRGMANNEKSDLPVVILISVEQEKKRVEWVRLPNKGCYAHGCNYGIWL